MKNGQPHILIKLMQNGVIAFFLLLIILLTLAGCQKESFTDDPSVKLAFSVDTVMFDTVFTSIGTITYELMVYNPAKKDVLISSIIVAKGVDSYFRVNVDGSSGNSFEDIPLRAGDSMYIFVEATIDPLNMNNPMVVQDSLVFVTNGNIQDVDLVAWGQDVHIINGEILSSQTWINDKPYLIYNSMLVDTLETLTIDPGVRVYLHKGSSIYICGTLVVNGTLDEPVSFLGDRLDEMYKDIPGQWGGMYFINGSSGNIINYAVIMNGVTGIHLGNFYSGDPAPDLQLTNTIIQHMTYAGLSTVGATISAYNCLIADCAYFTTILTTGGNYQFTQCTFANYWGWSTRTTPSLVLSNYYNFNDTAFFMGDLEQADFKNCIVYGNLENEIVLDEMEGAGEFVFYFDHVLMKVDTSLHTSDPALFNKIWKNEDPGFISAYEHNYELDTLAFAQDIASPDIASAFPVDILGVNRLQDAGPDLGTYERVENEEEPLF